MVRDAPQDKPEKTDTVARKREEVKHNSQTGDKEIKYTGES